MPSYNHVYNIESKHASLDICNRPMMTKPLLSLKFFIAVFFITVLMWLATVPLHAAQLVMIEEEHCVYCEKFNREIAPAYPKTAEGKMAPLRRIDLGDEWPEDLANIKQESLTPTFILIQNGREIDRLHGYQGDEFFWYLLGEMLKKLEPESSTPSESKPQ